jgi:hypothetical protein
VNGAQTVGCIGTEFAKSPEGVQKARVPVRFISLENCPPDFSSRLTRAANTQNRIERRDFVSLDPEQARLRTELMLDGKQYALKTGDSDPSPASGCSVTEATVALACAQGDSGLAVQAKREIGKLWEDIDRPPYRLIFNGSVSGVQLWRCVEILRVVDAELKGLQSSLAGRERLVAVHGNRLVLHLVFQGLPVGKFNDPGFDPTQSRVGARPRTRTLLSELTREIDQRFPASYIASLVKNAGKCKELCEAVLSRSLALAL